MIKQIAFAALMVCVAIPALAGEAWESVRAQLFDERLLLDGSHLIAIDTPYRTYEDARTDIAAFVVAPKGVSIGKVTVVLDENPMPVSAVFTLDKPQPQFFFDVTMRVNGPTPLHVVLETTDGRLFVAEKFVKTSGQGACSAPPGTDPKAALANLGQMDLSVGGDMTAVGTGALAALSVPQQRLDVAIDHPSHSGMQMDQISLLYIPMRYIDDVQIDLDGAGYVDVTGSISLSENPRLGLSVPRETQSVDVTMTDTDGTVAHTHKKLAGY